MIELKQVGINIVENMIGFHNNKKENSAIIINFEEEFEEEFIEEISNQDKKELSINFQNIEIDNQKIKIKIYINFLFVNKKDRYDCYISKTNDKNLIYKKETKWIYITNDKYGWRDFAFEEANKQLIELKYSIYQISNIKKLRNICSPENVVPYNTKVQNSEIFEIEDKIEQKYKKQEIILKRDKKNIILY